MTFIGSYPNIKILTTPCSNCKNCLVVIEEDLKNLWCRLGYDHNSCSYNRASMDEDDNNLK